MSTWIIDQAKAAALNLRRGIVPAEVVAVLAAGTVVRKIAEAKGRPDWWQVHAELGGASVEGFVNAAYLSPASGGGVPTGLPGLPMADLPPKDHRRRDAFGRAYPLDEPDMPLRIGADAAQTLGILAWLAPDQGLHARYQAGAGKTFCNIYAYDFCQRMGAYLPRVWWNGGALVRLSQGQPVGVAYGTTVHELNANALHDWCAEFGPGFGWTRAFTPGALQAAANAGKAAIIVARRKDTNRSGHIAAVVPESAQLKAARSGAEVTRPVQSQAGSVNYTAKVPATRWWLDARFASFGFWIHA